MKFTARFTIAILLILSFISAKSQMSSFWSDTLNQVLAQSLQDKNMRGLTGAVVFSDGSIWSNAEGHHRNRDLSTEFLYDIGSNTKSMTAMVILQLEEEGKLSLDDTLYSHISPVNNVPNGITLEQLLRHRSGVFSFTEHPDFYDEIDADDFKFWHPDTILSRFVNAPHFQPGANFRYSNTGYILLGKVIEAIENKPLNEVYQERIYDPLGLDFMFLAQYDTYNRTKTGSWLSSGTYYRSVESFLGAAWAAGGVVAQPEDFAIYAHNLLRGDMLSEESMNTMREGTAINGGSTIYGCGIMEMSYGGKRYLEHGGTTLQNSEMVYSLESDFSLVLINIDNGFITQTRAVKRTFLDLVEYIEEHHESVVGRQELTEKPTYLKAFPNPSNQQMTIQFNPAMTPSQQTVEVRDLSGRLVYSQPVQTDRFTLSKDQIGAGLFILTILNDRMVLDSQKIWFN
jgi:D-alanyl-D-alanine carboxypeptidase